MRQLSFALFRDQFDNQPRVRTGTWDEIAQAVIDIRRTARTPCGGKSCPEKFGRAWSPVRYAEGAKRHDKNVEAIELAVFDLEGPGHTALPREALRESLALLSSHAAALVSSHSGVGFYRLVLPLVRPVRPEEWPTVWRGIVSRFKLPADPTCINLSRLYFLPSACAETKTFASVQDGAWLDPEDFLKGNVDGRLDHPAAPAASAALPLHPPKVTDGTPDPSRSAEPDSFIDELLAGPPAGPVVAGRGAAVDDGARGAAGARPADHDPRAPGAAGSEPRPVFTRAIEARLKQLRRPDSMEVAARVLAGEPLAPRGEHDATLLKLAGILANVAADLGTSFEACLHVAERSLRGMGWDDGWDHLVREFRKKFDRAAATRAKKDEHEKAVNDFWAAELGEIEAPAGAGAGPVDDLTVVEEKPTAATWKQHLMRKKDPEGNVVGLKDNEHNAQLVLEFDPSWRGRLRFNELTKQVEWTTPGRGPLGDESSLNTWGLAALTWLQASKYNLSPRDADKLLMRIAARNRYNPVEAALRALPRWDGVNRPLTNYVRVDTDQPTIVAQMLRKFLIGAVARGLRPGCRMDNILIFEGDYGVGKSSFFKTFASLVPGSYAEVAIDPHNKDSMALVARYWFVELGEMAGTRRADRESMKLFLSRPTDPYRPPYSRHLEDFPRRAVFCGTTNDSQYLSEANRREWCVRVDSIDLPALQRDLQQIWAEALALFDAGEPWHLEKAEEAVAMSVAKDSQAADLRTEAVEQWFRCQKPEARPTSIGALEVATNILQLEVSALPSHGSMSVPFILKTLGFIRKKIRHDGRPQWRWVTPAHLLQLPQDATAAKEMDLFS